MTIRHRLIGWALVSLIILVALQLIAHVVAAQELDPGYAVTGYTVNDPIDASHLGLATMDGRFSTVPLHGCDWLADGAGSWLPWQSVEVYPNAAMAPAIGLSAPSDSSATCFVQVAGRMDKTPCSQDAQGCNPAPEIP